MKTEFRIAATLTLLAGIAGCNSIGDGSTIEAFKVIPVSTTTQLGSFEQGDTYKLFQCFRDEFVVIATFTDGTEANFSNRATWSTSDATVVEVSNGDIPAVFLAGNAAEDGSFYEHATLTYVGGTVVPKGAPGTKAVITAQFASLKASINVEIRKPTLRVVPLPVPATAVDPVYLGQGTTQRLSFLADLDGRTLTPPDLAGGFQNGFGINPFRWVLPAGTFETRDEDLQGDVDEWVIDNGTDRIVTVANANGLVTGHKADFSPYEVVVEQQLCPGTDPALRPASQVQVATIADDPGTPEDDRFVLSREAGFHTTGFAAQDLVIGSSQQLQLRAKLDANGDGSLFVEQNLNSQGIFQTLPLNTICGDSDKLIGCFGNSDFILGFAGLLQTNTGAAEGDVSRNQACLPLCLATQATLSSDATTPIAANTPVNFTAVAVNPPSGTVVNYLFDFGDDTVVGPQASATASHAYAADGSYTATVRVVDAAFPGDFLSQNAGAVRIVVSSAVLPANAAPTAALTVTPTSGKAPATVTLNATSSADPDADDSITVYEFDFGDGTPVIRQTQSFVLHTYLDGAGSPFTPAIRVYDESGLASTPLAGSEVTVTGTAPTFLRSNVIEARARDATLCSVDIQPPLAAAPTEQAFAFPGAQYEAFGHFVANTDTDACTDPEIGIQGLTRHMFWLARPAGDATGVSTIAGIFIFDDDFRNSGQVTYFSDVTASTTVDVTATPLAPFPDTVVPANSALTVTPCAGCIP